MAARGGRVAARDAWLDETIAEGDCDEVRRQLLQGFYQTLGFRGDWQDYFRPPTAIWTRCWCKARDPGQPGIPSSSWVAR